MENAEFMQNDNSVVDRLDRENILKQTYGEVFPTTIKTGVANFQGTLEFVVSCASNQAIDWSKSYLDFDICLGVSGATALTIDGNGLISAGSAPSISGITNESVMSISGCPVQVAYNAIGNCFQQFQHDFAGSTIFNVQNYAQVDAINKRLETSREGAQTYGRSAFLERGALERCRGSNFYQDGDNDGNSQDVYMGLYGQGIVPRTNTYQYYPSMGLFKNSTTTVGSQTHRLVWSIDSNYQRRFIKSGTGNLTPSTAYAVAVSRVVFRPCIYDLDIPLYSGESFKQLELNEVQIQALTSQTAQLQYFVRPSTKGLAYAEQSANAGVNTLYSVSEFNNSGTEILCSQVPRIQYAGINAPNNPVNVSVSNGGATGLQSLYYQYLQNLGSGPEHPLYSTESFVEYLRLGALSYSLFDKDPSDRSTLVSIVINKTAQPASANSLLYSVYTSMMKIIYNNGVVSAVELQDL